MNAHDWTVALAALLLATGCPADEDCSPDDDATHREAALYADADGDGFTVAESELRCIGDAPPAGWLEAATEPDCDDADGASFPGAPEVPDDGVDQDCDGEDAGSSVSDTVYVDSSHAACQDLQPGTVEAPNCTMAGASRLVSPGGTVLVAGGGYGFEQVLSGRTFLGGHDPATWTRDPDAHPSEVVQPPPAGADGFVVAALQVSFDSSAPDATVIDGFRVLGAPTAPLSFGIMGSIMRNGETILRNLDIRAGGHAAPSAEEGTSAGVWMLGGETRLEDSVVDGGGHPGPCAALNVEAGDIEVVNTLLTGCEGAQTARGALVTGGTLTASDVEVDLLGVGPTTVGFEVESPGRAFITGTVLRPLRGVGESFGLRLTGAEARAEVKNSVFIGASGAATEAAGALVEGGTLLAANCLFHGGVASGDRISGVDVVSGSATIVNSLVGGGDAGDSAALRSTASGAVSLIASDLWDPDQDAALRAGADFDTPDAINDCGWAGCEAASANMVADPRYENFAGGTYELEPDSECVDAGVDPTPYGLIVDRDIVGRPAPSDGDSDDMPNWDVGPHER